jgi:hypothetical protein
MMVDTEGRGEGMVIVTDKAEVRTWGTPEEMSEEIDRLVARSGQSLDELRRRGASYELDAEERGILASIEGLEWMLSNRR